MARWEISGKALQLLKAATVIEIRHEGLEVELYADGVPACGHREEGSVVPPC